MGRDSASKRGGKSKSAKHEAAASSAPYKYVGSSVECHRSSIYGAAFNPYVPKDADVAWLATCGSRYVTMYRLSPHVDRMEEIAQFDDQNKEECYYAVTWAIDEVAARHMIVVGGAKGIIRVLDPIKKTTCISLRGNGESVDELRTSPGCAQIVASASKDRTVRLWNIRNSSCLAIFAGACGHLDEVISLDFDADAHFLVSASMDHSVRVWDVRPSTKTGRRIERSLHNAATPEPAVEDHFPIAISRDVHANYVDCVRFLGRFIVSKSCEETIALWKFGSFDVGAAGEGTITRTETFTLHCGFMKLPSSTVWFIKFDIHPQNKWLACGNEQGQVHLWDLNGKQEFPGKESDFILINSEMAMLTVNRSQSPCVRQVVFSACGRFLVAVGEHGVVSRYDSRGTDAAGDSNYKAPCQQRKAS